MKKPIIVGGVDAKNDPVLKNYANGVAERAAKARDAKPKIGNLAQANATYDPKRDGPASIGKIIDSTQPREGTPSQAGGLSSSTLEGMKAIAETARQSRQQKEAGQPTMALPQHQPLRPPPQAPPPPKPTMKEKRVEEKKDKPELPEPEPDFDYEALMRNIQRDIMNNEAEKEHVNDPKNGRCSEIDFTQGIAEGEFLQVVEVVPGRLKATYRSITAMEDHAIRLWLAKKAQEDATLSRIIPEMLGLAMLVASVVKIGNTAFHEHLKRNQGAYSATFDEDAFAIKYDQFSRMPMPLLNNIGVHGVWFDERVRRMFTSEHIKNG